MKISLASPVYRESEKIQDFIHAAVKALKSISDDIEIVLVNDCSPDDTAHKIKELLPQYPFIKFISLRKNSGQHIATSIALKHTTGDFVFMMDSDMQVDPLYMIDFYNHIKDTPGTDIVSAARTTRTKGLFRRMGSYLISVLLQFIGRTNLKDVGSTFKLFSRKALDRILENDVLIQNIPILMLNLGLKIRELPIQYSTLQERKSNYRFTDLVFAIVLALLNFSTGGSTLIMLVILGVMLTLLGMFSVLGLIIYGMVAQTPLPTNFLIFFLILGIIGIQFLLLGLIVFKLERINKNMNFRRSLNQRIEYEN